MEHKHRRLKVGIRISLIVILLAISCVFTLINVYKIKNVKRSESIIYNTSSSFSPSICLINNEFLPSECSNDEKSYVTSLINDIKMNFKLNFDTSDVLDNYTYQYDINAELLATEKGDNSKVVYDNKTTIDSVSNTVYNDNGIAIDNTFDIDYTKYNKVITDFKKDYVLALDSKLIISANITITGNYNKIDEPIGINKVINVVFPLTEQTMNMDLSNKSFSENNSLSNSVNNSEFNGESQLIKTLFCMDIFLVVVLILEFLSMIPRKNAYRNKVDKILKEYDRAIATANNLPSMHGLKVIEIATFEELLDVKDNLEKPILFYENKHRNWSRFIILNDNEAYIYTLRAFDFDD